MASTKDFIPQPGSEKPQHEQTKTTESIVIPVIEEHVQVGKKVVEKGKVIVTKVVHEEQVDVDLSTTHEEIDVERVAVNQYVETPPPAVRHEGDTMIVPVLREVIEKRLLLVEELHITKKSVQDDQQKQQVRLRKEEVNVRRTSDEETSNPL